MTRDVAPDMTRYGKHKDTTGLLVVLGLCIAFWTMAVFAALGVVSVFDQTPDYGMFKDCEVYEDGTAVCHMADSDPGRGVK